MVMATKNLIICWYKWHVLGALICHFCYHLRTNFNQSKGGW